MIGYWLLLSAQIAIVGVSFFVVYSPTRFFCFSHAVVVTSGAYFFLAFLRVGMPVPVCAILAVACGALLGAALYAGVYGPLQRRSTSALVLLLASIALETILRNAIALFFGDATITIRSSNILTPYVAPGFRLTSVQIAIVVVSFLAVGVVVLAVKRSGWGLTARAVASDPELAVLTGLQPAVIRFWSFVVGSGLAALGGLLIATEIGANPNLGLPFFLYGAVAMIVGGPRGPSGTIVGALVLGALLVGTALVFGSVWQQPLALLVLILFLAVRPGGFLQFEVRGD